MAAMRVKHKQADGGAQPIMCDADAISRAVSSWAAELRGQELATAHPKSSELSGVLGLALELQGVPESVVAALRRVCQLAYEQGASDAEASLHPFPSGSSNSRDCPSTSIPEGWAVLGEAPPSEAGSNQPNSQSHPQPSAGMSGCPFFNHSGSRKLQPARSVQVSSLNGPYNKLSLSMDPPQSGSKRTTAGSDAGELPHESALPCTPPGRNCLSATQAASPQLTKEEEEEEEEEGRCLAPDTPALVQMSSPPSVSVHSGSAAHSFSEAQEEEDRTTWALDPLQDKDIAEELYSKMGGWEVLAAAVQDMYQRLLNDPRTSVFFKGSNTSKLNRHMTAFMGAALSGRIMYPPHVIWRMHKRHCGLTPEHVDVMATHFKEVLNNLNMDPDLVADAVTSLQSMRWVFAYQSAEEVMAAASLHHHAH